jgi:hypothetical protein
VTAAYRPPGRPRDPALPFARRPGWGGREGRGDLREVRGGV